MSVHEISVVVSCTEEVGDGAEGGPTYKNFNQSEEYFEDVGESERERALESLHLRYTLDTEATAFVDEHTSRDFLVTADKTSANMLKMKM